MPTEPTPQQAAIMLADIDSARAAMRHAIRAHHGHFYLWIWGTTWVAMPLLAHFGGDHAARFFPWICAVAVVLSCVTGFTQKQQVRRQLNTRLIAVLATIWLFSLLAVLVLRPTLSVRALYAYFCLVAMQSYVIAGLWTDSYLLWLGIIVTVLLITALFLPASIFWIWMAACGGGTLILSGFYVRHFWR